MMSAEQHTLTIKAELDTSGIQGKLDQLNQQKQRAPGTASNNGVALANQLTKLDRTLANLTRAVNQLAAGQKATSSLGTSAKSTVVVSAGGSGLGPTILPNVQRRTVTSTLMRDAVAAQIKFARSHREEIFGSLTAQEQQALSYLYGSQDNLLRKVLRRHADRLNAGMELDPAKTYHEIFASKAGPSIPVMTKLRMLNQAPLAALGWGPKSWRAARLAPVQTKIPAGLYGSAAGFIAGQAIAPALDYFANEVYKEPTSTGHWLTTIGKHAVSGTTSGIVAGGAIGTAFGGVGAAPGAAIGAVAGGIVGALQGVFDSISQVNADEAKTAEEVKRRNEQIRANWKKVEEALPKAQQSIQFRRSAELTNYLAGMADTTAIRQMRGPLVDRLGVMRGERLLLENQILEFKKSGNIAEDTGKLAGLMKKLDDLNAKISHEEANLRTIDAAIEADDANAAAEELQRQTMLKTVDKLQAQQALAAEGRQVGILSQFGTRGQLEAALSEYSTKMREAAAARDKAAAEMKAAAEDGREEAFDEAKEKYQTQLSLLDTLAGFRGSLGQALSQMIAASMPNYTGLQANELGQLAAIGGFGSASALADPSLELTRQQVELLRDILRKIPEDTAALYS